MVCFLATIPSIQVRIKASKASCHISTSRTQVTIMHSHRPSTYSYQCRFTQMSAQALLCPRMRLAALYCYGNTLLLQSLYEGGRSWEGEKDNQTVGCAMAEDCLSHRNPTVFTRKTGLQYSVIVEAAASTSAAEMSIAAMRRV